MTLKRFIILSTSIFILMLVRTGTKMVQAREIYPADFELNCPADLLWGNTHDLDTVEIMTVEVKEISDECPAHVKLNGVAYLVEHYAGYDTWLRFDTVEITYGNLLYVGYSYLYPEDGTIFFDLPHKARIQNGLVTRLYPDPNAVLADETFMSAFSKTDSIVSLYEEYFGTIQFDNEIVNTESLCFWLTERDTPLEFEELQVAIETCYGQKLKPGTLGYEFFVNQFYPEGATLTQNGWLLIGTAEQPSSLNGGWNIEVCKDSEYAVLPSMEIVSMSDVLSKIPNSASKVLFFSQFDSNDQWWGEKISQDLSPYYLGQMTLTECHSVHFGFGGG